MIKSKTVRHLILRVAKENSAFVYFTLESNEGISFYSTQKYETGQAYRDIEIYLDNELSSNFDKITQALVKRFDLETILDETIPDQLL